MHVAAYIEQHLAAIKMLFDYLMSFAVYSFSGSLGGGFCIYFVQQPAIFAV